MNDLEPELGVLFRRVVLIGGFAAAASACGDDPLNLNGSLSFNHSGSVSGSFNAVGRFPLLGEFSGSAWAVGTRDDTQGMVALMALTPQPASRYDMVVISIPRLSPGSSTITTPCSSAPCANVAVEFGLSDADNNFSFMCALTSGTIAISSISDNRVSGSFSGTGTCSSQQGGVTSFAVTSGSFDVPLLSEEMGLP